MADLTAIMPRYRHLRELMLGMHNELTRRIPRKVIKKCGKRLGVLRGNRLLFNRETDLSILMDYCLYSYRAKGQNLVQEYWAELRDQQDNDKQMLLKAMAAARYSLFEMQAIEDSVGVHVRDMLTDEQLLIVDRGFAESGSKGLILASRMVRLPEFCMTTGAAIPVGPTLHEAIEGATASYRMLPTDKQSDLPPEAETELATFVIKTCLAEGTTEHVTYQ